MLHDDDQLYAAMVRRDADFEGAFYVGVRTTGVFCRPTCPARPPKRENCEFFRDAKQALLASYRPCARCRPLSHPDVASALVRRLVDAVEREPGRRWRASDLASLDMNASTAQRQFKKRFGMTFIEYARARRLGMAFQTIRGGGRVIAAQLDSGYESGSGFRSAFAKVLGAPPAEAARALFAAWLDTPLGPMIAIADERMLHLLEYADRRGLEGQIARLRSRAAAGVVPGRPPPLVQIEAELAAYFAGRSTRFAVPLALTGTPFQRSVWDVLLAIPVGETRSYAEVARTAGRARAVRAAAQANGANPFAIIIPCHRVVSADGGLGGYGGGLWRKGWLLDHERGMAAKSEG